MPDFLTSNPVGLALTFVLLGTCMQVLIYHAALYSGRQRHSEFRQFKEESANG